MHPHHIPSSRDICFSGHHIHLLPLTPRNVAVILLCRCPTRPLLGTLGQPHCLISGFGTIKWQQIHEVCLKVVSLRVPGIQPSAHFSEDLQATSGKDE